MQTIIDEKIAIYLAENGYFYIMHRFEPEKRLTFIKDMQSRGFIASISVGVKEEEYAFIEQLAADNLHLNSLRLILHMVIQMLLSA